MVDPQLVVEVKRKLEQGLKQRQIARDLPISRGTIGRIANGTRPDYEAAERYELEAGASGPPVRCPECGAKVVITPCRACKIHQVLKRGGLAVSRYGPGGSLALDLTEEERRRYEEIHVEKAADDASDWLTAVLSGDENAHPIVPEFVGDLAEQDVPDEQDVLNAFELDDDPEDCSLKTDN